MRRVLLLAVLVLCSVAPLHAQVFSVYATSSSNRFSNVLTGTLFPPAGAQPQYTSFWTSGIGGGVTFNFLPVGPVRLGLDLRGSTRPGTTGADTAMAGLKLTLNPPLLRIKPYIQGSGAYIDTRTPNVSTGSAGSTFNNQYAAWEVMGGLDIPLIHFVDLRLVEVGGGRGVNILGSSSAPQISLLSINSGIVVHF